MIFMCFCCFIGDNMSFDGLLGNIGAIVGGVVGALVVIVVVVVVVFIKNRREGKYLNLVNIILLVFLVVICR